MKRLVKQFLVMCLTNVIAATLFSAQPIDLTQKYKLDDVVSGKSVVLVADAPIFFFPPTKKTDTQFAKRYLVVLEVPDPNNPGKVHDVWKFFKEKKSGNIYAEPWMIHGKFQEGTAIVQGSFITSQQKISKKTFDLIESLYKNYAQLADKNLLKDHITKQNIKNIKIQTKYVESRKGYVIYVYTVDLKDIPNKYKSDIEKEYGYSTINVYPDKGNKAYMTKYFNNEDFYYALPQEKFDLIKKLYTKKYATEKDPKFKSW